MWASRISSAPQLNETPHKRNWSAKEVHDEDRNDDGFGYGWNWPRRAHVAAAQAGRGAPFAPRRGSGDGVALARRHRCDTWRDWFLAAGEAALTSQPTDGETLESERLKARLGDMLLKHELLEQKITKLEGGRPLGRRRWKR